MQKKDKYEFTICKPISLIELEELFISVNWKLANRNQKYFEGSFCWVTCFFEGELIGFVNTISNGCSDAYLYDLIVNPNYQKEGIAHHLILMIKSELKVRGIENLTLIMSPELETFYKKQGFKIQLSGRMKL